MSRLSSAILSWVSSFTVAYLVGSRLRDQQTGLLAGMVSATVAATASWAAYGVAEAVERRRANGSISNSI